MLTSEILRAAKAGLTPETWYHGGGRSPRGAQTCAHLAIWQSYDRAVLRGHANDLLRAVATGLPKPVVITLRQRDLIWDWNDAPERTLQDVHEAFDAAIAIAEQEEAHAVVNASEPIMVRA